MWHDRRVRIPSPALVVLVGPSGAGKSTWAAATFAAGEVVSSDRLRAVVGEAEDDLAASADAFALLEAIVDARLRRGLTVVVDTLGLDAERRRAWVAVAARRGVPAIAIAFDTPAETCRAWNRDRPRPVPAAVVADQVRKYRVARGELADEGFADVHGVVPVPVAGDAAAPVAAGASGRPRLRFGLSLSRFDWPGGGAAMRDHVRQVAGDAEAAGFESLWFMDHMRQIPMFGPGMARHARVFQCAEPRRRRDETHPPRAHGGRHHPPRRSRCWARPSRHSTCSPAAERSVDSERPGTPTSTAPTAGRCRRCPSGLTGGRCPAAASEDVGARCPRFNGRVISVPEAACYPRPLQARIPILVGGEAVSGAR